MKTFFLSVALLLIGCFCIAQSQDRIWPQFRGVNGSGVASETAKPPIVFSESNLLWKTELPVGVSSPVIWQDNLFITGYVDVSKELQTICLNRNSGQIIWSSSVKPDTIEKFQSSVGSPAQGTVVTDGERVISYFGSCGLFCYDMEGNMQWRYQIACNKATYGSATSPVIASGKVILIYDIGAARYLLALDKKDGSKLWKTSLKNPEISNVGGQSVPCINNDKVYVHLAGALSCFSINDGSQLWTYPFLTEGVTTPFLAGEKVITAGWYNFSETYHRGELPSFAELAKNWDKDMNGSVSRTEFPDSLILYQRIEIKEIPRTSGTVKAFFGMIDTDKNNEISGNEWDATLDQMENYWYSPAGLMALNPEGRGAISEEDILWRVPDNIPEVPTPVFYKNRIYMIKDGGYLTCVDSESGKVIYVTRTGITGPFISSPVAANGFIYLIGFYGKMLVVKAGDIFEVAGQYDLKETVGATPAIIGDIIYIKTKTQLLAYKNNQMF